MWYPLPNGLLSVMLNTATLAPFLRQYQSCQARLPILKFQLIAGIEISLRVVIRLIGPAPVCMNLVRVSFLVFL
jgi:hypothetical protein